MLHISPFQFFYAGVDEATLVSAAPIVLPNKGLHLLTGPSGSGKSTLLSLIKGLSPHYTPGRFIGEIYYNNELIDKDFVHKKQNEIVYLFQNPLNQIIYQNPQLEFCFTAESQQISYENFAQHKASFEKAFGLASMWSKKTSELSLGQAQRLLLGSLLATNPKVLLLDEPTAFMDQPAREQFYRMLADLKEKFLVLLVDHHLNEVKHLVDSFMTVDQQGSVSQQNQLITDRVFDFSKLKQNNLNTNISEGHQITLNRVSYSYKKDQPLLKDISLSITASEIIAIKGENGSGKSTLLKLLVGSLKPTQGEIHQSVKFKDFGYVMQNPEDNFICDTANEELAETAKDLVNLFFADKNLNVSPFSLSEGEKRRLSLLVHLNPNKKVILYDEPTFGLDEKNKYFVAESLLKFRMKNILQIVVSHDDTFINAIADRVFTLKDGKLYEA
ncbi:MAG: ATP-binding cassette domain-containing protein [Bdellovibrionota bacterium]